MRSLSYCGDATFIASFSSASNANASDGSALVGRGRGIDWWRARASADGVATYGKCASVDVFVDARAHGARELIGEKLCAIVWGERRVGVIRAKRAAGGGEALVVERAFAPFASWVHDVRGVRSEREGVQTTVVIGLSDNTVERWEWGERDERWTRAARVACESRCSLYALALGNGERWDDLVVASGTIFNEIQVWRASEGVVRGTCVGHEGSVMRARWSDDDRAVYSASDDRTARVWDVADAMAGSTCGVVRPSAVLAGHVARVWDCVRVDGERPVYATAGEDCTVRVWDANRAKGTATLAEGVKMNMECELAALRGHRGRGIWRLCALKAPRGETWLASAGADGSVKLWNMSDWTRSNDQECGSRTMLRETFADVPPGRVAEIVEEVEEEEEEEDGEEKVGQVVELEVVALARDETPKKRKKKSKRRKSQFSASDEFVRVIRIVRHDEMFVATNHGFLYRVTAATDSSSWIWMRMYETVAPIMSMHVEPSQDHDVAVLADLHGIIHVVRVPHGKRECVTTRTFQASEPRVLMDVFWSDGKVFASIIGGLVRCWDAHAMEPMLFELQNPYKHRVLAVAFSDEAGLVLIGDQKGNACVYDASSTVIGGTLDLIAQKWSAHDNGTSINACSIRSGPEFVTAGRDSTVRTWSIANTNEADAEEAPAQLILNSKWTTPSKSTVLFAPVDDECRVTHVAGYRETDFVVYALSEQRQLMRIRCQAHNKPHAVLFGDGDRVVFAHLQGLSIHIIARWSKDDASSTIPQTDKYSNVWSHGREIHTIRIIPPPAIDCEAPLGIVTGSEDGTVMRLLYTPSQPEGLRVHSPRDVCKHPGGRTVKALSIYKESDTSYVLCVGGAKEVLLGFRLTWCASETNGWDLKSSALVLPKPVDKPGTRAWTKGCGYVRPRSESDQRIMDVVTYSCGGRMRVLYSTSLGDISILVMDEDKRAWRQVSTLKYHQCPVLVVHVLCSTTATWACTGGTDGTVAVWCLNDDDDVVVPAHVIERAHQSGVNSLSMAFAPGDASTLVIASGGDDQVLRVEMLCITGEGATTSRVGAFDFAHSSAIRRVWTDGERIISTSVDQRVKVWRLTLDSSAIVISPLGGVVTQAPEPEAIDVLRASSGNLFVAVAGRGFELFNVNVGP